MRYLRQSSGQSTTILTGIAEKVFFLEVIIILKYFFACLTLLLMFLIFLSFKHLFAFACPKLGIRIQFLIYSKSFFFLTFTSSILLC
jgi:hypothetical protein